MAQKDSRKIKPLDSFARVNMWLIAAGYLTPRYPRNKYTKTFHKVYRILVLVFNYIYAAQHVVYSVQLCLLGDMENFIEAVVLAIPISIGTFKYTSMYVVSNRIDKLMELMEDPIFGTNSERDEALMMENARAMTRMSNYLTLMLTGGVVFWIGDPILKRMQDPNTIVHSYMPFSLDTWPRFLLAMFLDTVAVMLWTAFGNVQINVVIATYYAQARVQLQIINYNLNHLFDQTSRRPNRSEFLDVLDANVQKRFVFYIKRYERVCWFTKEVASAFNWPVSCQVFVTYIGCCLAVFQMSSVDLFSVTFWFMIAYYILMQSTIFIFCYYGGLVEYESKQMIDSLYLSEWLSVSPRFRRQLLMAMTRWIKPIRPKCLGIIPLSLATFLSITRSAYSLFTVMKTYNTKDSSGERGLAF